jgi:hypothetical protein
MSTNTLELAGVDVNVIEFSQQFTSWGDITEVVKKHIPAVPVIKKSDIYLEIVNAEIKEVPENYLLKNLFNSAFSKLNPHDFELFDKIFRKANKYISEIEYLQTKQNLFKAVLKGVNELPVLLCGTNNKFWQLTGHNEMLAYRLWAVTPTVKLINIQSEII